MSSPFSERIRHHPRIAVTSSPGTLRGRDVLAVKDQLLVCTGPRGGHALSRHVADWLSAHGIDHRTRTTVFAGLQPPGSQDADVFELRLPVATDIFHVTEGLRTALAGELKGQPGRISPNHVLVPAMDDHSCPNGPPVPSGSPPWDGSAPSEPRLQVTVIDSGWIVSAVGWLLAFASTEQAETLADGQWKPGSPDAIVVPGTQQLPALTGHAGFIGGVIASRCTHAQITVRNHNGVFDRASDDFPTEAAVARSLYRSAGAQVVNVGFAFRAFSDVISRVWEVSLRRVGETTPVVAPAGNQDDSGPRYPAALHLTHKNVIGVSSIHAAAGQLPAKSDFSNYGPWVTCAAGGENIQSWFPLAIDVVPEEAPGGGKKHFGGWATWNGTSFATPRVVAAIANGIVSGLAPTKAWAALTKPAEKDPDLGYVLESLP